jgi:hypothetical protein
MPLPFERLPLIVLVPAAAALLAGLLLGYVIKSIRARRRLDELAAEAAQLRQSLAAATHTVGNGGSGTSSAAFRITGTEIAAIITAIAGLAAAGGTTYVNSQAAELRKARADLATNAKDLATVREKSASVLYYDIDRWVRLGAGAEDDVPQQKRAIDLDEKKLRDVCRGSALKLVYLGTGPAQFRCGKFSKATLQLTAPAKILITPDK